MLTREERFNRLHEEHFEAVRRYVWRRDPALTDDVVAETFLVAWRRLDAVPADARPWLIGVARNARLNIHRSARRQQQLARRLEAVVESASVHGDSDADPAVRAALARLSETDREVLLLSVWDELDRSQIAGALGCTKATVSVRLHRAKRRLGTALVTGSSSDSRTCSTPIPGGVSDAR